MLLDLLGVVEKNRKKDPNYKNSKPPPTSGSELLFSVPLIREPI